MNNVNPIVLLSMSNLFLVCVVVVLVGMLYVGRRELKEIFEFKKQGKTNGERALKSAEYLKIQYPDWTTEAIAKALGMSESTLRRKGFKRGHDRSLSHDDRSLSHDDRSLS